MWTNVFASSFGFQFIADTVLYSNEENRKLQLRSHMRGNKSATELPIATATSVWIPC